MAGYGGFSGTFFDKRNELQKDKESRRAAARKAFDEYVNLQQTRGMQVSLEDLSNMAEEISGGDNWLRGTLPADSMLQNIAAESERWKNDKELQRRKAAADANMSERQDIETALSNLMLSDKKDDEVYQEGVKLFGADVMSRHYSNGVSEARDLLARKEAASVAPLLKNVRNEAELNQFNLSARAKGLVVPMWKSMDSERQQGLQREALAAAIKDPRYQSLLMSPDGNGAAAANLLSEWGAQFGATIDEGMKNKFSNSFSVRWSSMASDRKKAETEQQRAQNQLEASKLDLSTKEVALQNERAAAVEKTIDKQVRAANGKIDHDGIKSVLIKKFGDKVITEIAGGDSVEWLIDNQIEKIRGAVFDKISSNQAVLKALVAKNTDAAWRYAQSIANGEGYTLTEEDKAEFEQLSKAWTVAAEIEEYKAKVQKAKDLADKASDLRIINDNKFLVSEITNKYPKKEQGKKQKAIALALAGDDSVLHVPAESSSAIAQDIDELAKDDANGVYEIVQHIVKKYSLKSKTQAQLEARNRSAYLAGLGPAPDSLHSEFKQTALDFISDSIENFNASSQGLSADALGGVQSKVVTRLQALARQFRKDETEFSDRFRESRDGTFESAANEIDAEVQNALEIIKSAKPAPPPPPPPENLEAPAPRGGGTPFGDAVRELAPKGDDPFKPFVEWGRNSLTDLFNSMNVLDKQINDLVSPQASVRPIEESLKSAEEAVVKARKAADRAAEFAKKAHEMQDRQRREAAQQPAGAPDAPAKTAQDFIAIAEAAARRARASADRAKKIAEDFKARRNRQ